MEDFIQKVLTRKVGRKKVKPTRGLLYTVYFALAALVLMSMLEIVHVIFLHSWNAEVFASITGFIGTVTGILISRHT